MSEPRLLQTGPMTERFSRRLAAQYAVTPLWLQPDPDAWLEQHGGEIDIVVSSAFYGCGAAQLQCLTRVRAICHFGVGYDSVDVAGAQRRGIVISNTPDVLNDCTADLAMGLLIDTARRIAWGDRFVRAGTWAAGQKFPLASKVSGKRLGIVGLGRIGAVIARRAAGFDMELRYHNRSAVAGSPYRYEPSLVELARWADFLVLALVGGAGTRKLISAEVIDALGPQGVLINISRGSVVDEAALVAALVEGRLGGAGLDVYESEPSVPAELLKLDNVVLTPHVGSGTEETRLAMEMLVLDNIASFVASGKLLTPI